MKRILILAYGYYGRGETLSEAYRNIKAAGARETESAILYVGSEELQCAFPYITGRIALCLTVRKLSALKGAEIDLRHPIFSAAETEAK